MRVAAMVRIAKREIHPRQAAARAERGLEPLAFSIAEFARLHGISIDHYFRLARLGLGPRVMRLGHRTLISRESASEWRRAREEPADKRKAAAAVATP
jgi:hypothetical protein